MAYQTDDGHSGLTVNTQVLQGMRMAVILRLCRVYDADRAGQATGACQWQGPHVMQAEPAS